MHQLQNRHRSSNPTTPPPKSKPKPISATQKTILKFGNYFSKSPRLTTNRLSSPKNKDKKQNKRSSHNYISSNKRNSTPTHKRSLSNGIESSSSNPNSMDDTTFNAENHSLPRLKSANTRYRQLMKEYADTESTVSSSDIQDDISSVASDEQSMSYKRPPRIAPPPPPRNQPPPLPLSHPKLPQHSKSKSLNAALHRPSDSKQDQNNTNIPPPIDTISSQKPKYSKSAVSTPSELTEHNRYRKGRNSRGRSQIKLSPTELLNNPYLNMVDFDSIKTHKKHIGLPPPPASPQHKSVNKRPKSASLKRYKSRNNLPFYAVPQQISKSRSMNVSSKKKKKRHVSEDITHKDKTEKRDRLHYRAQSARMVDDLSLSEKIYQNRRTVLHRLRGKNKKDVMSKLDISIGKVSEKLKVYVRNLVSLQDDLNKINCSMKNELSQWESINNFSLTNLCRSYYSNYGLLIQIRIEIATKYCECFRDKYRQLKKTRDRIKKDAKRYNLDDLVLTVEAAMMSASNIRLPSDIKAKRENEAALGVVIDELKQKYSSKKYSDIVQPMTADDRTKHILTMLVQIIDTSNKTTMTKNVSDGLPYFHPSDNGYQVPFEQLLYDPRFEQKGRIDSFIAKYINNNNNINNKAIDRDNLSLTAISTFIYKLTNSFLNECKLNKDSPFFDKLFWDCTNLMIGRSIFDKCDQVIQYIINKDKDSVDADCKYKKQLIWMKTLDQKQIGIETEFTFYHQNKTLKLLKTKQLIDSEQQNEERIAYYKAINRLKAIDNISVPQDSIVLVIDTVHCIQKCAMKYSNNQVIISGDSLFPIIVYCLVQSNVDYWNRWIFMMKRFYTEKILSFGQTGFCFSLINAAVKYILDQKPENFK